MARAAEAIHDAESRDCMVIARVALEGAIRGGADLTELFAETRSGAPVPRRRHASGAQIAM